jgi:hypothetical protein
MRTVITPATRAVAAATWVTLRRLPLASAALERISGFSTTM